MTGRGSAARWAFLFGTENEAGVLPRPAHLGAVGGLDSPAYLKGVDDQTEQQREITATRGGLHRIQPEFTFDPLDLLADTDLVVGLIHVMPAQAEHLA
jgi:hypothetical protein